MLFNNKHGVLITFIISFLILSCNSDEEITILSYNVNCLFDDVKDGTEYTQYDPTKRSWNTDIYHIKLKSTAEVIIRSCPGGPDIICLQEVENLNALFQLNSLYLKNLGYEYVILLPTKDSATNIGILSRYPVIHIHSHEVGKWQGYELRNILEVEIDCQGHILHLFNNHWKSRLAESGQTEEALLKTVEVLLRRVRIILEEDMNADIVIAGDFNEDVEEYLSRNKRYQTAFIPISQVVPEEYYQSSLFLTDNIEEAGIKEGKLIFYEPWYEIITQVEGSYAYQGQWYTFDHMLLSAGLFDTKGLTYKIGNFKVIRFSFLVNSKTGFPLKWISWQKNKGYSDHFPLLLTLNIYQ